MLHLSQDYMHNTSQLFRYLGANEPLISILQFYEKAFVSFYIINNSLFQTYTNALTNKTISNKFSELYFFPVPFFLYKIKMTQTIFSMSIAVFIIIKNMKNKVSIKIKSALQHSVGIASAIDKFPECYAARPLNKRARSIYILYTVGTRRVVHNHHWVNF